MIGEAALKLMQEFTSQVGQNISSSTKFEELFGDFYEQKNDSKHERWKDSMIKEYTDLQLAGLSVPGFYDKDLLETSKNII